ALLVIESNSMDNDTAEVGPYLLKTLNGAYHNFYTRSTTDNLGGRDSRPGFHTNRRTKTAIISSLLARLRDGTYIERDARVIDEYLSYERTATGALAARPGHHDDLLMTRAIGLWVDLEKPGPSRDFEKDAAAFRRIANSRWI
ncbi:MAG: hypothetical protein NC098_03590, partial [Lachnoclostridium sp.]|nr:hypothetical protein [Lachnoclostridium sp.]